MPNINQIVCKTCGELKIPNQTCQKCPEKGYRYGKKLSDTAAKMLIERRRKAREERKKTWKKYKGNTLKPGAESVMRHNRALAILKLALADMLALFEQEVSGEYAIYEDTLKEKQHIIRAASKLKKFLGSFRIGTRAVTNEFARKEWERLKAGKTQLTRRGA